MELMVTLALVGILVGLAVPSMREFIRNNRLTGGANDVLRALRLARSEAIKRQRQRYGLCQRRSRCRR